MRQTSHFRGGVPGAVSIEGLARHRFECRLGVQQIFRYLPDRIRIGRDLSSCRWGFFVVSKGIVC